MCLAIPMEVVRIKGNTAVARTEGLEREVNVQFLKNLKKGDYVVVHTGFAIERLDKKKARQTLELFKEMKG